MHLFKGVIYRPEGGVQFELAVAVDHLTHMSSEYRFILESICQNVDSRQKALPLFLKPGNTVYLM